MSTIQQLHDRTEQFLKQPPNNPPVAAAANGALEALGPPPANRRFIPFLPDHMERALTLTSRFMELANQQPGEKGLDDVLDEADRAAQTEDNELVKFALMVFITHHPEGQRLPIPPLQERAPQQIVPSPQPAAGLEPLGALGVESPLDWFREDTALMEHHNKWHVVYPGGGIPDPQNPANRTSKNRQGELFWYMHQQMLARYDAERRALGLPPAEPLEDYRVPIPEGYEPNLPGFSNRVQDAVLDDLAGYTLTDHETRRDRLRAAAQSGSFQSNGVTVPVSPSLFGDTMESNVGSVDGAGGGALSFYGSHHNLGHALISSIPDPAHPDDPGVMAFTTTAVRDPIFYRWHRHVDDTFIRWQETLTPHDFSDAPQDVRIRKSLNGAASPNQSPDILLCTESTLPGAVAPGFDGKAVGQTTFGGANWNSPPSSFPDVTDELKTSMHEQDILMPDGSTGKKPYLEHEDFYYFIRAENSDNQPRKVTVRIFLAAKDWAEDRRMWIEMDKCESRVEVTD